MRFKPQRGALRAPRWGWQHVVRTRSPGALPLAVAGWAFGPQCSERHASSCIMLLRFGFVAKAQAGQLWRVGGLRNRAPAPQNTDAIIAVHKRLRTTGLKSAQRGSLIRARNPMDPRPRGHRPAAAAENADRGEIRSFRNPTARSYSRGPRRRIGWFSPCSHHRSGEPLRSDITELPSEVAIHSR
jgi:hypothetical protein